MSGNLGRWGRGETDPTAGEQPIEAVMLDALRGRDADTKWTNHDDVEVWLRPMYRDGERIGITDCCPVAEPCVRHEQWGPNLITMTLAERQQWTDENWPAPTPAEPDAGDANPPGSRIAGHVMACHNRRNLPDWTCSCEPVTPDPWDEGHRLATYVDALYASKEAGRVLDPRPRADRGRWRAMSIAADCAGCVMGNHAHHNRDHGIRKGLIGGTYCACVGDCEERARVADAEFAALLAPVSSDHAALTEAERATGWLTDAEDVLLADWWVSEGGDHEDLALDSLTNVVERIVTARVTDAVEQERAARLALVAKWSGCWCDEQMSHDHDPRVQDCPQHGDASCQHMAEGIVVDLLTPADTTALDDVKAEVWLGGWRAAQEVVEVSGVKCWAHTVTPEGEEPNPHG